ncbi:MAG: hypothetical protein KDJ20_08180 [Hyphomicrobiales bacterium]|nr:hypothetical protein [Rhodoblastus sp.]MCC2104004.1 hypothetical protein [Hyphomicrobiales bacterium]MCC2107766.1 hypothetical protein [Hyphomicrobiales bacterium]
MTDMDNWECPPTLKVDWFGEESLAQNVLFRVAVREVEAWLLADRLGLAAFLGVNVNSIERGCDLIQDPKRHLLAVARRARREIREDLLPPRNSVATQGFGYNQRLSEFVLEHWSPSAAVTESPSLERAVRRIRELA